MHSWTPEFGRCIWSDAVHTLWITFGGNNESDNSDGLHSLNRSVSQPIISSDSNQVWHIEFNELLTDFVDIFPSSYYVSYFVAFVIVSFHYPHWLYIGAVLWCVVHFLALLCVFCMCCALDFLRFFSFWLAPALIVFTPIIFSLLLFSSFSFVFTFTYVF